MARPRSLEAPAMAKTLAVENGLPVGDREPALVQRAAHDDPVEALGSGALDGSEIVEGPDSARVDQLCADLRRGPCHIRQLVESRAAERPVHVHRREDESANAPPG